MRTEIEKLTQILRNSNNIVFFGGAGVSTESNIPDFRSANGLFNARLNMTLSPEQLVSHTYFIRFPEEFFNFYKAKLIYPEAKPNGAHITLANLEEMGKLKAIITQNIDGLHQAAGSKNVFELHGSIHRNYCIKCNDSYDMDFILNSKGIPTCPKCSGTVRPDVVLYEEGLDESVLKGAIDAISKADTLIIGGTSLVVYPAANLINYFKGKNLVLINKSSTSADSRADLVIHDSIGKVLSESVNFL
ncbi:NAD-dependent deacetylase [Clostridium sulfidigenes]|uniref:NAD-dependent protein deacetylase n=1 Tax=Clostridium sulfidigenes TaxID=318464 RepID=A0A084JA09_9CLOT|nr:NAD-dependent protein deacylase [Clostridium sulfidigenes]KEZ85793.1 NAD-dependent deacetylase [Clostridium sulfidigenes]